MTPVLPSHEVSTAARAKFLGDLQNIESHATGQLMDQYRATMGRIATQMAKTLKGDGAHEAAILAGTEHDLRIAAIQGRSAYILSEFDRFGAKGQAMIAAAPPKAVALGMQHAAGRIEHLSGSMVTPNPGRIEQMAARLSEGTTQSAYFDQFALTGTQNAVNTMTQGVILGDHPGKITSDLSAMMANAGPNLATFVRSEVMGAARDGLTATMQDNADVVTGWVWNADEGDATCEVCWAENGTQHPIDEEMDSHPNCRCIQDPMTKSYSDILGGDGSPITDSMGGIVDTSAAAFSADERFASVLTPEQQMTTLGPGKYQLWADGKIKLADLVTKTDSPAWGPGLRATTLQELRAKGVESAHPLDRAAAAQIANTADRRAQAIANMRASNQVLAESKAARAADIAAREKAAAESAAKTVEHRAAVTPQAMSNVTGPAKYQAEADRALEAIAKVHDIPTDPGWMVNSAYGGKPNATVEIKVGRATTGGRRGAAVFIQRSDMNRMMSDGIKLNPRTDATGTSRLGSVVTHEFGHFMDFCAMPFRGQSSVLLTGSRVAAGSVKADGEIEAIAAKMVTAMRETDTYSLMQKEGGDKFGTYFRSPEELFARGYAQWIAVRSGDNTLMRNVEEELARRGNTVAPVYRAQGLKVWTQAEFAPIANLFDDLFRAAGVLK